MTKTIFVKCEANTGDPTVFIFTVQTTEQFVRFKWDSVFCYSCNFKPVFNTLGVCLYTNIIQQLSTCLSINKSTGSFGTNIEQSFYPNLRTLNDNVVSGQIPSLCSVCQHWLYLAVKKLKKTIWGIFLLVSMKASVCPKHPFLPLLAMSAGAYERVRPVEKTTPKYLYWFTSSSVIPSYSHFSLAATCTPFLRVIVRELSRLTKIISLCAALPKTDYSV